ncbi:hypothetical protein SynSYN20_00720 [Synechococcus sp. SYN20]|nr:hypothetical protein SynSYN20_00720 [Synechococcus sp. SYN20]
MVKPKLKTSTFTERYEELEESKQSKGLLSKKLVARHGRLNVQVGALA